MRGKRTGKNVSLYIPETESDIIAYVERMSSERRLSSVFIEAIKMYRGNEIDTLEVKIQQQETELKATKERRALLIKRREQGELTRIDTLRKNFNSKDFHRSISNLITRNETEAAKDRIKEAIGSGCLTETEATKRYGGIICQE